MKNQRRKFSPEFKFKVVSRLIANETPVEVIAEEYEISVKQIYEWRRKISIDSEKQFKRMSAPNIDQLPSKK
jgi:transposase-like protein